MESLINNAVHARFGLDIPLEPVIYSRMFIEILSEQGIGPGKLLEGTGLAPDYIAETSNFITVNQQIRIYYNIARLTNHPTVGLLNGQQIMPYHHGIWGYAMQTAANLGQALRIFNQYFDVAGPIARQLLQIDGKTAHWQSLDVIPVEPARRIGVEEMLGGNFNLCKQLTGGKFKLKALYLDYPAPEGAEHYEELFQCPILFEQDIIKMEFDASLLNLKMKNADPESQRVCEQRCQELLKGLKSSVDLVDQIRRIIYENPCDRRDEYSVASILCMSTRTLRRQLKSANTSFRQVLSEVLKALAFDYLNQTSLSIDEISFLLGYSDTSSFRHAFKQWTGETPTTYRNQLM